MSTPSASPAADGTPVPGGEPEQKKSLIRVAFAATAGTTLEFYEFMLFGTAAALVFGDLFFPDADPTTATLLSLSVFAVGFGARPIGGIVFGHYGDRIGRKKVLFITLCLMGGSTMLIGLVPSYAAIGIWAPIMLVLLRCIQGFALGGEVGGAILLLAEHSKPSNRGFIASLAQTGAPAGNLLATGAMVLFAAILSEADFNSWGWRIPFLLSGVVVVLGLWVRMKVEETPSFAQLEDDAARARQPMVEVVTKHRKPLLLALGVRFGPDVVVYIFLTYFLTYATKEVDVSRSTALIALSVGSVFWLTSILVSGRLADRFGRRPVYVVGAVVALGWGFAFFPLINTGQLGMLMIASAGGFVAHGMMLGPQASFLAELFPARVRYSGVNLGYQLSGIYGGSLAPIIAVALLNWSGTTLTIVAYMSVTLLVTIATLAVSPENRGRELDPELLGTDGTGDPVSGSALEPTTEPEVMRNA